MTGPVPIRERRNRGDYQLYFIHPLASRLVHFLPRCASRPMPYPLRASLFGIFRLLRYFRYSDVRLRSRLCLMMPGHVMDGADVNFAPHTDYS